MIYIFDFDNTLFQTEYIKQELFRVGEEAGLILEEAKQLYAKSRVQDGEMVFTLEHFCQVFEKETGTRLDPAALRERVFQAKAMTPGAEALLTSLQQEHAPMYLLSLGDPAWQGDKVEHSGIGAYFQSDHIFYTSDIAHGKRSIIHTIFAQEARDEAWLFNDKPDETATLLEAFPSLRAYLVRDSEDSRYGKADFTYIKDAYGNRVSIHADLQGALTIIS